MPGLLDKERTIARPGFNRWLVPPAALAIHLSIGMAYGFSVFWLPLARAVGVSQPIPCPDDMSFLDRIVTTTHDWSISMLGWIYTLFFVFLGGAAALFGRWVERNGPRKAGVIAACCWGGGLAITALGVFVHQIWIVWLGAGVVGGIGLGLGYISPVSTLIKWFPDRRGLATGLAIMGFGGGAMIGAPLANLLLNEFATETSVGAWQTFLALAALYWTAMTAGAFGYRIPPPGWKPAGWTEPRSVQSHSARYVPVTSAHRTSQFWLLWGVLCLNVSAGIGVIGMASPMLQEVFGGRLLGIDSSLADLSKSDAARVATIAAGFAGLLSLCNIVGRIGWASLSDRIGRKLTYSIFFLLGATLYALAPGAGQSGSTALFVGLFCVILTMYGGGFASIPAYLADLFGSQNISAIHGRLLTAWSVAGVLGPVAVNSIRQWQLDLGVPPSEAYNATMYVLAALLLFGLACNLLVRPVDERFFVPVEDAAAPAARVEDHGGATRESTTSPTWPVALAWTAVGAPLLWGVWNTFDKARAFFQ